MTTRKEKLLERKAQIIKELKLLENREKTADRAKETRQMILFAAFVRTKKPDEWKKIITSKEFDDYLVRKIDRAAFDLAPLPSEKKDKEVKTEKEKTSHKGEKQEHKAEHKASKSEPKKYGTFTIPDDDETKRGEFVVEPDIEDL